MASSTSSSEAPARSATSAMVGERPRSWESVLTTFPRRRCSSWMRRGTRTAHGERHAICDRARMALDEAEIGTVVADREVVLVDDGLEDLLGQGRQRRADAHAVFELARALDDERLGLHAVAQNDVAGPPLGA